MANQAIEQYVWYCLQHARPSVLVAAAEEGLKKFLREIARKERDNFSEEHVKKFCAEGIDPWRKRSRKQQLLSDEEERMIEAYLHIQNVENPNKFVEMYLHLYSIVLAEKRRGEDVTIRKIREVIEEEAARKRQVLTP